MMRFGTYRIESAGKSDIGRRRHTNEDALLVLEPHGVFCIADGVGGSERSELASQAVVHELRAAFEARSAPARSDADRDPEALARVALDRASTWINDRANRPETAGMATTVVALIFRRDTPGSAFALHAGDSRCYRFRHGRLRQLTRDHSGAELMGVRDETLLPASFRNLITRAVGTHPRVELDRTAIDVQPGDLFLLCSDGLSRMVPDKTLTELLTADPAAELKRLVKRLVDAANDAGGSDNITVALIRISDEDGGDSG